MKKFYKYHGAGNDFILIDNRAGAFDVNDKEKIKSLCHRRFGIGADGAIFLENCPGYDFKMIFVNSDGSTGSMCGNGGRCVVDFAHNILKITKDRQKIKFLAVDGEHTAEILSDGQVKLQMQDVDTIGVRNDLLFVCQGTTPHNILFVRDLKNFPVVRRGRNIRNSDPEGVNVNFTEIIDGIFHVRTYERGVEDETLACGTGATSVAVVSHHLGLLKDNTCNIKMPGGDLKVNFEKDQDGKYKNIYLTGPAACVFEGEIK